MKVGILYSADAESIKNWIIACNKRAIDYEVIDLCSVNWLEKVINCNANFFIQRPEGNLEYLKTMYDEKLYVITKLLNKLVFPSYEEVKIYENKKILSYFLYANNLLHAQTNVFYYKKEAISFIDTTNFPIVGKTSIGASGSGVEIIRTKKDAIKYIYKAFSKSGLKRRFGPNPNKGNPQSWLVKSLKNPQLFLKKLKGYLQRNSQGQRGYVIFQEYIEHDFEWRVTKCGEYYYAYQKLKLNDKCSGSGVPDGHFIEPPLTLMNYVRDICDKYNFSSMAVDIFPTKDGKYIINELQTHWGVDNYDSMIIDGERGVYKYDNGWKFIKGEFWDNDYFDTRLLAATEYYKRNQE